MKVVKRRGIGNLKEQIRLKVVVQSVSLMFKTSLRLRKGIRISFLLDRNDIGSNPKTQEGRNVDPPKERPTCSKCGKKHVG